MKTERFTLSKTAVTQIADGSGIATVQNSGGFTRLYVGDAAPTGIPTDYLVLNDNDVINMGEGVLAWAWGVQDVVVVTV